MLTTCLDSVVYANKLKTVKIVDVNNGKYFILNFIFISFLTIFECEYFGS